jgi:hypothetical protein
MNTLRFMAGLALAFLLFFTTAHGDPTAGKKRKKDADEAYPAVGGAAEALLCNRDYCIEVWVFFAGPFFETLEVRGPLAAPVFLQDSQPAQFFPEQVRLLILATENSGPRVASNLMDDPPKRVPAFISPPVVSRLDTDIALNHKTMMGLWFKAEWKHNGEARPVSDLTWEESYNVWRGLAPAEWYYTLTFSARDVPLTDTLVITVFDDSGKQIASLDATVPLGVLPYVHNDKKRD